MRTALQSGNAAGTETELLVVFTTDVAAEKDAKPEIKLLTGEAAIQQAASPFLSTGEFSSNSNEILLLHAPQGLKAKRLLLVGLGKAAKATVNHVRRAAGTAVRFAKPRKLRDIAILAPADGLLTEATERAIAEGAILADFDPDTYRSDRKDQSVQSLTVIIPAGANQKGAEEGLRAGTIIAESQNFTRSLVNEPGNRLTPTIFGQRAAEMAREFGLKCEVYGAEKLHELKMGAFWSVAQGSDEPPALIVLTYDPEGAPDKPVLGLVGKGITFDTGGISIKPSDNMEKMKYDMAGGAAMIGAMRAIAQLKPRIKVIAVVCATENMPSGKAQKPGDVQIAMSGKSIEIINTDAEGRLVLADGLAYAKQLGATHLIDAATLTGAVAVALGQINAGAFSNDEDTWQEFSKAVAVAGERFWRLPLDEEYRDLIRSDIADIKNTGGRYGGA
ncbi:MAG TPA: leucyl aminopeptidase, partial [Pseudacidobacterium sp.]|nr:leucyl aminopeptidase [Pseudacidobacterium sp.]